MNVTQGNLKGYRCPVTGQLFLSDLHSKRVQAELLHSQQLTTYEAMQKVDQRFGANNNRPMIEYARLFDLMRKPCTASN